VEIGRVEPEAIRIMESNQYDFAPVFDQNSLRTVVGLISRDRLKELYSESVRLTATDKTITRPELHNEIRMDMLLELMKTTLATIVVRVGTKGKEALGLFTRADLNRHPFRAEIYFVLAHLEGELAKLIRQLFNNPWDWLELLSDDKQARIIGYWEISKKRGVDNGPVGAAMLTELLQIAVKSEPLRKTLGYESNVSFKKAVERIPDLRNQIMYPVRPLIVDEESISKLRTDLETVFDMLERLRKANRELRGLSFRGSSN
jgi:hypothetical protein